MEKRNEVHIAIVDIPTIKNIVFKVKTIESRFSKNRIKPFGIVEPDDMILLKASGKGVYGYFYVDHVDSLTNFNLDQVRKQYNSKIVAGDSFWESKKNAQYATLLYCKEPVMANSNVNFKRKGMDGWVVIPHNDEKQVICFAGQICSGKTTYAKKTAEKLNAQYIHFGSIIRNYAKEHGYSDDRNAMQIAGQEIMNTIGYKGLMDLVMKQYNVEGDSRTIVFDGVRHMNILDEIYKRYENAKLVYVKSTERERYRRYLIRTNKNITFQEFKSISSMPVETEIPKLEKEANFIINSVNEENIDESNQIICNIIASILTGYKINEI